MDDNSLIETKKRHARPMLRAALLVLFGALVGAGVVQTLHVVGDRRGREVLERKLRCRGLVEKYVADRSVGIGGWPERIEVVRVDFSPVRNSCVASTNGSQETLVSGRSVLVYGVVDLVSGEALFKKSCILAEGQSGDSELCSGPREAEITKARDEVFDSLFKRTWLW